MDLTKLDRKNGKPKDETDPSDANNRNPYMFKPAEWFFKDLANGSTRPTKLYADAADQNGPVSSHGRVFRLQDESQNPLGFLLIQFMRPKIWRIRFHHVNKSAADFTDYNTRTIVQNTLTELIKVLDLAEGVNWQVEFVEVGDKYYVLQSVVTSPSGQRQIGVQLWIQREPFKVTAVRSVRARPGSAHIPSFLPSGTELVNDAQIRQKLLFNERPENKVTVVWQTKDRPLEWQADAAVLSIEKPTTAMYTGFGEQGGKRLFKDNTVMNYFNFDNMRYYNVYGQDQDLGPLEDAEPLYHSEPYWIEMNAHPGSSSQIGTFIDNYSQVCVDLGRVQSSLLRVATRFNSFQGIFMAGDDVGEIIRSYTSIIGRPFLKPRYVLGAHQGCYGYETQDLIEEAVTKYRQYELPLDGMHVDVDLQRDYRTFTIDTGKFPDPKGMFESLRAKGVKCSTNITPVVNRRPDKSYSTLNEGLANEYFVFDNRDVDPGVPDAGSVRYLNFGGGNRWHLDPNPGKSTFPGYHDDTKFPDVYNKGSPFCGGVDYGGDKGAPGHYPNLNNKTVRDWWGQQYKYLFDTGLEFVWQDMTQPCMSRAYGDMCSWPFRLLLDNDGWSGDPKGDEKKKSIEIWSLYSYNLHKATFKGLQLLDARKGKRNFIIGRGSFAGAQRYAGLWTGDNVSSWAFLDISVAQVLALGMAGVTVAGADVGGFEPPGDNDWWADPELVIRWYSAYSLLPWLRNHYVRKGKKWFQEPYGYYELQQSNSSAWQSVPESDRNMYYSVLPAIRYILQLRYSLLQLMYDAMFENMINGMPIARAMIITDPDDSSLYQRNQWFTRSQYILRNDILVAPALIKERKRHTRRVYLPYPDSWYPMNLNPGKDIGNALRPEVAGGTYVEYDCHIGPDEDRLPYITPMYIREGAIIPQIETRMYVPDRTRQAEPANPITINLYPGKDSVYDMYLDDGISRESAPTNTYLSPMSAEDANGDPGVKLSNAYGDQEANNVFRHVRIEQVTTRVFEADQLRDVRTIKITNPHDGYGNDNVMRDIGAEYRLVIWHAPGWPQLNLDDVRVTIRDEPNSKVLEAKEKMATVVHVPTSAESKPTIVVTTPAAT